MIRVTKNENKIFWCIINSIYRHLQNLIQSIEITTKGVELINVQFGQNLRPAATAAAYFSVRVCFKFVDSRLVFHLQDAQHIIRVKKRRKKNHKSEMRDTH